MGKLQRVVAFDQAVHRVGDEIMDNITMETRHKV